MLKKLWQEKGVSYWAILIVLAFMTAALIVAFWPSIETPDENFGQSNVRLYHKIKQSAVELNEKAKIEKWITDNGLNEYGDPADTLYAGGTPLFNEATGKTLDRYEYIRKRHPDKPWDKN